MTNQFALFEWCQKKPRDEKHNIASHLYISSIPIEKTNFAKKIWYKLNNWITDEQDSLFVVQKHNPTTQYVYRVEEYHKKSFQALAMFFMFT